jgi:hypothetical protein
MTEFNKPTAEEDAFNEIERQAKQRKEAVLQALHSENERLGLYKDAYGQQEPVAYINVEKRILEWAKLTSWETPTVVNLPKIPLYTHPPQRTEQELAADDFFKTIADKNPKLFPTPQREWVGLTDERRKQLISKCWNEYIFGKDDGSYFIEWISVAIEAELKEKNT